MKNGEKPTFFMKNATDFFFFEKAQDLRSRGSMLFLTLVFNS